VSASKVLSCLVAVAGLAVTGLTCAPVAQANNYPMTTCDLSTGCIAGTTYGNVTLTSLGTNEVQVQLTLNNQGNGQDVFALGGAGQPLMFELASGTYALAPGTSITDPLLPSGTSYAFRLTTGSSMMDDGTGTWNSWISCPKNSCGNGTTKAIPAALTFDLVGTGSTTISLSSFILNTPAPGNAALIFGTDIGIPTGTVPPIGYNTGDVGAPTVVPLPPSAALLGSGLILAGLRLARRRGSLSSTPAHLAA
jgi:hypothetical protein